MPPPRVTPISPVYWNDRSVVLYEGDVTVDYAGGAVTMPGVVTLDWQPTPRIEWSGSSNSTAEGLLAVDHWNTMDRSPAVRLPTANPRRPRRRGAFTPVRPAAKFSDSGPCDGLDFQVGGGRCDEVTFNIINWLDLLPLGRLANRQHMWMGRWELADDQWLITIDARADLRDRIGELHKTRGFGFTHVGRLRRADGSTFTSGQAVDALHDLFLFLTLVRGANVGVAVPVGSLDGEVSWQRWTTGLCAPYRNAYSWADPHTSADISTLWPLFAAARADPRWSHALLLAVRYYAEAVQAVSAEVTVTLAQAGLELLGTAICVDRDASVLFDKWDTKTAPWRLRRLLKGLGISLSIPTSFKALRQAGKAHSWNDGVQAVTSMRNTVTHWSTGKPNIDVHVWVEARQLVLYYLEMTLLWALGYDGRAFDRTVGQIETGGSGGVPWSP